MVKLFFLKCIKKFEPLTNTAITKFLSRFSIWNEDTIVSIPHDNNMIYMFFFIIVYFIISPVFSHNYLR